MAPSTARAPVGVEVEVQGWRPGSRSTCRRAVRGARRSGRKLLAERQPSDDGWLRGAGRDRRLSRLDAVARLRAHERPPHPDEHDGAAIVAKRSTLDGWIKEGGDRCP